MDAENLGKENRVTTFDQDVLNTKDAEYILLKKQIETNIKGIEEASSVTKDDLDQTTSCINEINSTTNNTIEQLSTLTDNHLSKFRDLYELIDSKTKIILISTVIIFYFFYFILFNGRLEIQASLGLILVFWEYIIIHYVLDTINSHIEELEQQLGSIKKDAVAKLSKAAGSNNLQLKKLDGVKTKQTTVSHYLKVAANLMKNYDPTVQALYSDREIKKNQRDFALSMKNSLKYYGFNITDKTDRYLTDFYSDKNGEPQWISEACNELAIYFAIPHQVLELAYADYAGDPQLLRNTWQEIREDEHLLDGLIRALIHNGKASNSITTAPVGTNEGFRDLILKLEIFSLDSFRQAYQLYFFDVALENHLIIDALMKYGFHVEDNVIRNLKVKTFDASLIPEEIIGYYSKLLSVPDFFIRLIFFESKGDVLNKARAWNRVISDDSNSRAFIELLLSQSKLVIDPSYANCSDIYLFCTSQMKRIKNYSLEEVNRIVSMTVVELKIMKRDYFEALEPFEVLDSSQISKLNDLLINEDSESRFAEAISASTGLKKEIIQLLYYDRIDNRKSKSTIFRIVIENNYLDQLSIVLLRHPDLRNITQHHRDLISIAIPSLLKNVEEFNAKKIVSSIHGFSKLINFTIDFQSLLLEEGFSINISAVNISDALRKASLVNNDGILKQLMVITKYVISSSRVEYVSDNWCEPICLSCLTYYLCLKRDEHRSEACRLTASDNQACQVLYHIVLVREREEGKAKNIGTPLDIIIGEVVNGKTVEGEYIQSFTRELESGYLYMRIGNLVQARLDVIQDVVEKADKSAFLADKLGKMRRAVDTFLNSKLNNTYVIRALNTQIISAYIITTSSRERVITEVVDDAICNNPEYKQIIFMKKGSGKSTRIGLVPFNMDFDAFSKRFGEIFEREVGKIKAEPQGEDCSNYSLNLIRVFPSDDYFKPIGGTEDREDPISQIRSLILDNYGEVQTLQLLATVDEKERKSIAFGHMINQLFCESTIYLLAEDKFLNITRDDYILKKLNSSKLSNDLATRYGCIGIAQLASKIYSTYQMGKDREKQEIFVEFQKNMSGLIPIDHKRKSIDLDNVSKVTFEILLEIGGVINAFANDSPLVMQ